MSPSASKFQPNQLAVEEGATVLTPKRMSLSTSQRLASIKKNKNLDPRAKLAQQLAVVHPDKVLEGIAAIERERKRVEEVTVLENKVKRLNRVNCNLQKCFDTPEGGSACGRKAELRGKEIELAVYKGRLCAKTKKNQTPGKSG